MLDEGPTEAAWYRDEKARASKLLTAHIIKTKHPRSVAISEFREDVGNVLEVWEREIERIYRFYRSVSVKSSDYGHIKKPRDIRRADRDGTLRRETRHGANRVG